MIGAGVGSLAGGYISEEKLGGSYELGAFVGNLVGGVAGAKAYDNILKKPTVLWSGGEEAKNAAMEYAKNNGGKTLEMTLKGKTLDKLTKAFGYDKMKPYWDKASFDFASKASGNVTAFINPLKFNATGSVFSRIEYPTVVNNILDGVIESIKILYL